MRRRPCSTMILQKRLYRRRGYSSNSTTTSTRPIVIVGGGPVGLFLSNLLSSYNVPNIVLEAQSVRARFQHPQAHFLNTRTMEILRSHLPNIYQNILQAMPPKKQWQTFSYTHCMSSSEPLATILHPIHTPIQAGVDANGTLLDHHHGASSSSASTNTFTTTKTAGNDLKKHPFLSPCTVGHLAQHTFGLILYQAAVHEANRVNNGSAIYYETRVIKVENNNNNMIMQVTTADGRMFETDVVVAADGANSLLRSWNKIGWAASIKNANKVQHVMNIHVTNLTKDQITKLHRLQDNNGNENFAMLYSVYSSHALGMVVCHDLGDYVVQIPYFPPYDKMFDDTASERLGPMLESIFGFPICLQTQVVSIGKWTMSTRVAESYYVKNSNNNVGLVGDAAHVFPPAGGLGMNTGIQDAHNLGWKLAWAMMRQRRRQEDDNNKNNKKWKALFESYDQERRPVAIQNAALAHRNYHRVLVTMLRQCYLDDEIPTMVTKALDAAPLLPSFGKAFLFRALQQTVMTPLSWLGTRRGLYREHIKSNLRQVLQRGMGLPLIFPRHELFFTYDKNKNAVAADDDFDDVNNNWFRTSDTMAPLHVKVVFGQRLPHVDIQILSSPTCVVLTTSTTCTSTIDLPAHVARQHGQPAFCLWHVVRDYDSKNSRTAQAVDRLQSLAQSLSNQLEIPVEVIHLVTKSAAITGTGDLTTSNAWVAQLATVQEYEEEDNTAAAGNAVVASNPFTSLLVSDDDDDDDGTTAMLAAALILVRPDGHVAHLVTNYYNSDNRTDNNVEGDLLQAALQSGGALLAP